MKLQGRTFTIREWNEERIVDEFKFFPASFTNHHYIILDDLTEALVGVKENDRMYFIGDRIEVTGDIQGYICPGIDMPGCGTIIGIETDSTDHYYFVKMDNGEEGIMKSARIKVVPA